MISISHWGMFPDLLPRWIMPRLSAEEMAHFEQQLQQPGGFVEIKPAVLPQRVSPELDKAIQDELDHPPASIMKGE